VRAYFFVDEFGFSDDWRRHNAEHYGIPIPAADCEASAGGSLTSDSPGGPFAARPLACSRLMRS